MTNSCTCSLGFSFRLTLWVLVVAIATRTIFFMGECSFSSTEARRYDGSNSFADVPPVVVVWDDQVDKEVEERRCASYGFEYDGRRTTRRRIFVGSMIADDSWDVLQAVAAEGYGMFHSVAYVESNTTQADYPRNLRFTSGSTELSRLQSLFGPNTKVTVDNPLISRAFEDLQGEKGIKLAREDAQRQHILYRWKLNGMQPEDIGIVSDADETYTRDFMRAIQICDVPIFRKGHNCRYPKMFSRSVVFEFAPDCIQQERRWHHPDLALGECIELIGNERRNKPVERVMNWSNGYGYRMDKSAIQARIMANEPLPLLNSADIRMSDHGYKFPDLQGDYYDWDAAKAETNQPIGYTGYHFHNFFTNASELRFKYKTYGHAIAAAHELPLGRLSEDIQIGINCIMNRTTVDSAGQHKSSLKGHVVGGLDSIVGPIPILFQNNTTYRRTRMELWRESIEEDEAIHGRYNETKNN